MKFGRLATLAVTLLITGCATTPPSEVTSVTPTPSVSPTLIAIPTVSVTPSATVTPTQELRVLLTGKGVGSHRFGAAEDDVEGTLTAALGQPDDIFQGVACELDSDSPYGRQLAYGSTYLVFESAPRKGKQAPRKLTLWSSKLDAPLISPLAYDPELPAEPTFAQLTSLYPKGKLTEIELGGPSIWRFTTPSGVWYRGESKTAPDTIGAGTERPCE
ncbi:MAG: hypothetical protein WAS07_08835 [Micropruina sp.]|nr:hypothetical protein [Micropruina sp.]